VKCRALILAIFIIVFSISNASATFITGIAESERGWISKGIELGDVRIGFSQANDYFGYF
jgi:hypothetical protein